MKIELTIQSVQEARGVCISTLRSFAIAALLGCAFWAGLPASAQTETVFYNFQIGEGNPTGPLLLDAQGNLFGTTQQYGFGSGTVFELTAAGVENVLYTFLGGWQGSSPSGNLIRDEKGNLYGTTFQGGRWRQGCLFGCGTVFKLEPTGVVRWLHHFGKGGDGAGPQSGLTADSSGNLYGTTTSGGDYSEGAVFEISPPHTEALIYSFHGFPVDGGGPIGGLVRDGNGNLFGTTYYGGTSICQIAGCGTVFEITAAGEEKVLYSFAGGIDGRQPAGGLVLDRHGNLYGTTEGGGPFDYGTVFKVTPSGAETVLHLFTGGADGGQPLAGLVRDKKGNLFGTTRSSGATGFGTVFKITPSGVEKVLHSFSGNGEDGAYPYAGLVMDSQGTFYGTTLSGGLYGAGVVYKIVP
jgi:uncharacterized repeat protein (TIGR03803 family)